MTPSRRWSNISRSLVILQVAGSLVLTVGASLFVLTLRNLESHDTGYSQRNVLLVTVDPSVLRLGDVQQQNLYDSILEGLRSLPGVKSASMAMNGAFTGNSRF